MKTQREKKLEIALLKEKIERISNKKVVFKEGIDENEIQHVSSDWKDVEGLIDSYTKVLKKFGINTYEDPLLKGSDMVGVLLSKQNLSEKELRIYGDNLKKEMSE